jgi:hypothetical protein
MLRPPVGAAILGFMALLAGVVDIVHGLRLLGVVTFGPAELGSGFAASGAFALIIGLAWVTLGYAFWTVQAWAWLVGMILALLGIVSAIFVLFETGSLAAGLGVALLPLVVIWYLQQADIKATFNVAA